MTDRNTACTAASLTAAIFQIAGGLAHVMVESNSNHDN